MKGDMSFVGPRPLLPEYLKYYNEIEIKRHQVKPGLTGLAQIKFGNSADWENRLKYDLAYVDNQGIFLDIKLLFLTFIRVLNFSQKRSEDIQIESFSDFAKRR